MGLPGLNTVNLRLSYPPVSGSVEGRKSIFCRRRSALITFLDLKKKIIIIKIIIITIKKRKKLWVKYNY
jgi:hypothetical protein